MIFLLNEVTLMLEDSGVTLACQMFARTFSPRCFTQSNPAFLQLKMLISWSCISKIQGNTIVMVAHLKSRAITSMINKMSALEMLGAAKPVINSTAS